MRRPLCLLFLLPLLLAACADERLPQRRPVATAAAELLPGEPLRIAVTLLDLPPGGRVREIVLIAPDGGETAAPDLAESSSERGPGYGPTGIGVTLSGGSASGVSTGVSVGVNSAGSGLVEARTFVTGTLTVPDPGGYAEAPRDWRIEIRWVDVTGDLRIVSPASPRR